MNYQDYIIFLLASDESPINEALFNSLVKELQSHFGLGQGKAKAIVQKTLRGLYMTNAEVLNEAI